jgi:CDK inhibitor PHO81
MHGHAAVCKLLLENGACVNVGDQDGNTPLIYAIIGGHYDCVEELVNNSELNHISKEFKTPISIACQYGRKEIVKLLLSKGFEQTADSQGLFPLHIACREGNLDIAKCLIEHDADIEVRDTFNGWTPVFFCASEGNLDCLKLMIESNCALMVTDENDWTPMAYCLYMGHIKAAKMLTEALSKLPNSLSKTLVDAPILPIKLPQQKEALAPSQLFMSLYEAIDNSSSGIANSSMEICDDNLDDIPSLALPPPVIPLRV